MNNRHILDLIKVLILAVLVAVPSIAADTEPDLEKELSLEIELKDNEKPILGEIVVYKIADMDENLYYKPLPCYRDIYKKFAGTKELSKKLNENVKKETMIFTGDMGKEGVVSIENLDKGIYLVVIKGAKEYIVDPFVISLPERIETSDGVKWEYKIVSKPKYKHKPLEKSKKRISKSPKMGDFNNMEKHISLSIAAIAICILCIYKIRKK